jgi:peptide/nickel transport system ATP-binding protein
VDGEPVFQTRDLSIGYETEAGLLTAVRNASVSVRRRECFGLVGESGSGKTTLAMGAIRYPSGNGRITGGTSLLRGEDLTRLSRRQMRAIWGSRIGVVYQNPSTALNPSMRIGRQIAEVARRHLGQSERAALGTAAGMLEQVAMPDPESIMRCYPHQLSGGMLQRAVIAMALTAGPELLILDEPTTALDVTTQAVVLDLVGDLKRRFDSSILYITHDLAVVSKLCDRVGVMYAGTFCEQAPMRELYARPLHPYTLGLLGCIPRFDLQGGKRLLTSIPGIIPRLDELPAGCIFAPRCPFATADCTHERPPLVEVRPGHLSACIRWSALPSAADYAKAAKEIPPREAEAPEVLRIDELRKSYPASLSLFSLGRARSQRVKAVDGVTLWVRKGNTLGVVGESGCGKTTMLRAIIGLAPRTSGEVLLSGDTVESSVSRRSRTAVKRMQMVFQNPEASLNPRLTVGKAIGRPVKLLAGVAGREVRARVMELLRSVSLSESYYNRLPEELSGGEKQRAAIARAFAADPDVVLLDEPLSSLDVSVQASLVNLLTDLQERLGVSYLFISHDLAAVQHLSHWIVVMYLGALVEWGDARDVFAPPYHPYTEALLSAIPVADPDVAQRPIRLEGSVPSALAIPGGCRFHTRCPRKIGPLCERAMPPWREGKSGHRIACHIPLDELARLQADTFVRLGGNPK